MTDDSPETKNLIYLVADSLRPDYLGCYGGDPLTTEIDRLAAEGVLFENVVSAAPWTVPSVAAHTTGVYPHNLGIFTPDETVDERAETIFQRLGREGYTNGVFFDSERRREQFGAGVDHFGWSYDIEGLLDFISDNSNDRFSIFNLYRGTHLPYVLKYSRESWYRAKDELMDRLRYGGKEGIEEVKYRYARSIEHFSEWYLRAIIDRLEDENLLDETAIVVTGDHGEHWGKRLNDQEVIDLFDLHGPYLYDEVLKVPLVMYNIGDADGTRVGEMVRSVDILPTILDAFGLEPSTEGSHDLDGKSVQALIQGKEGATGPQRAFSSTVMVNTTISDEEVSNFSKIAVVEDHYKLIFMPETGEKRLFDLTADPEELEECSTENPSVTKRLFAEIEEEITGSYRRSDAESEEMREHLEDLGYL